MIYLVALSLLLFGWWLPWWGFAPICALAGALSRSRKEALLAGGLGVGLSWLLLISYLDFKSQGKIGNAMAGLFSVGSSWGFVFLNVIFGSILGMLCAEVGHSFLPTHRPWISKIFRR